MLRSIHAMIGQSLEALDGTIGSSSDFLFDDQDWVIRYMVADTRRWLPGRKVLISPLALGLTEKDHPRLSINLTRQEIEASPHLDEYAPVSREYEILFHKHYGYAHYWEPPLLGSSFPGMNLGPARQEPLWSEEMAADYEQARHNHVRSVSEVIGYGIHAFEGQVGQVKDFLIDEASWIIRWLVVDTRTFLPGPKKLVAPGCVDSVDWEKNEIQVNLPMDRIKTSPEFDPTLPITDEYEKRLAKHYAQIHNGE